MRDKIVMLKPTMTNCAVCGSTGCNCTILISESKNIKERPMFFLKKLWINLLRAFIGRISCRSPHRCSYIGYIIYLSYQWPLNTKLRLLSVWVESTSIKDGFFHFSDCHFLFFSLKDLKKHTFTVFYKTNGNIRGEKSTSFCSFFHISSSGRQHMNTLNTKCFFSSPVVSLQW